MGLFLLTFLKIMSTKKPLSWCKLHERQFIDGRIHACLSKFVILFDNIFTHPMKEVGWGLKTKIPKWKLHFVWSWTWISRGGWVKLKYFLWREGEEYCLRAMQYIHVILVKSDLPPSCETIICFYFPDSGLSFNRQTLFNLATRQFHHKYMYDTNIDSLIYDCIPIH